MTDTGRMVPAIEGDWIGGPWIEFWGDWLHRVDVPECMLALLPEDMGGVYHVHRFDLGEISSFPCVRWSGFLVIVIALRPFLLILGI